MQEDSLVINFSMCEKSTKFLEKAFEILGEEKVKEIADKAMDATYKNTLEKDGSN